MVRFGSSPRLCGACRQTRVMRTLTRSYRTGSPKGPQHRNQLSEKDYQHFLGQHVKLASFDQGTGLRRPDIPALEKSLPIALAADPLHAFKESSTPLSTACDALELYLARLHVADDRPSKLKLRERIHHDVAGKTVLHWLLQNDTSETLGFEAGMWLAFCVAHCLVAENELARLQTWIWAPVERRKEETPGAFRSRSKVFNAFKMKGMLIAQAFWTSDRDPLRDAFTSFWWLLEQGKHRYFPLAIPGNWLMSQCLTTAGRDTNPDNFERLWTKLTIWKRDEAELGFQRMRLTLRHPTAPSAQPALEWFQRCAEEADGSVFRSAFLRPQSQSAVYLFFWTAVETAQMLDRCNRRAEARWVIDFAHSKIPYMFWKSWEGALASRVGQSLNKTPLPRNATAREDEVGIKHDFQEKARLRNEEHFFRNVRGMGDAR